MQPQCSRAARSSRDYPSVVKQTLSQLKAGMLLTRQGGLFPSSFGMEHGDVGAEANNVQEVLGRVVAARWRVSDGGLAFQEWHSDTMTW